MGRPKYLTIARRAAERTGAIVLASSWQAWLTKVVTTSAVLLALWFYTRATPPGDEALFADAWAVAQVTAAVVVGLTLLVFLAQLLFVAPFQLWRSEWSRAEEAEGRLEETSDGFARPIKDRVSLTSGLLYAVFHDWTHTVQDLPGEEAITLLGSKVREFRQVAHDGHLAVWGAAMRGGVHEKLDPGVWTEQQVEWFSMIDGSPRTERLSGLSWMPKHGLFRDLLVSRSEVERLFGS